SCKAEEESGLTPADDNNAVWRKTSSQRCLDFYLRSVSDSKEAVQLSLATPLLFLSLGAHCFSEMHFKIKQILF
ncbi:MAG: hypothetical protein PHP68_06800, partial [Oscillospiraceae bacterium]|nr:hypothetical protein [Oscillospiraceae bacterium]